MTAPSMASETSALTAAEIVCEGVTKQFVNEPRPAVDHVSFKVEAGNFVVLLGPSGCGKTTLLKMINRLYEPSGGKIWIGGTEVHYLPATELRRHIGYVIQQVGLFPHMKIDQNVAVVPRLLGWDEQKIKARVAALMDIVGLPQYYLDRHPRQLSGGEQQRIGLVRALAADPPILLMDEPFAAIDAITRECLQEEFLDIQSKVNKTILFVTHDVEEAFRLADKIVIMKLGKLVQYGTPLEIVTQPQDEFVQELVGTSNMLRRLSLINVQSVLDARTGWSSEKSEANLQLDGSAVVHPNDDLRSALSTLLNSGADVLKVIDPHGGQVGEIHFSDLRAALVKHAPRSQEQG
ncbi:MAG: ABC transporter ATP-binding protein [Anaerolineaceae bacterium]|nr:ABC transporter ATP-binding protein [Anaerolineaceae bacterium]